MRSIGTDQPDVWDVECILLKSQQTLIALLLSNDVISIPYDKTRKICDMYSTSLSYSLSITLILIETFYGWINWFLGNLGTGWNVCWYNQLRPHLIKYIINISSSNYAAEQLRIYWKSIYYTWSSCFLSSSPGWVLVEQVNKLSIAVLVHRIRLDRRWSISTFFTILSGMGE